MKFNDVFGVHETKEVYWHPTKKKFCSRIINKISPEANHFYEETARCFKGGFNYAEICGFSEVGEQFDWDLEAAYPHGLLAIREPSYGDVFLSTNPKDFCGGKLGFGYLDFEFIKDDSQPCIPVKDEQYGLIYPKKGSAYFTAPELELALSMGARLNIKFGYIIPWASDKRIFEKFVKKVRKMRNKHSKGSLENQLYKIFLVSLYGKLGQSLRGKKGFDTQSLGSKPIPPSKITNPYFASFVTGFIRAVLCELVWLTKKSGYIVYSATTDGMNTNAPKLPTHGKLFQQFKECAEVIDRTPKTLSLKHGTHQLLIAKTRTQFTLREHTNPELDLVLAKGGVRPPIECRTEQEQNEYLINLYLTRTPKTTIDNSHLISTREQWLNEMDMIELSKRRRLNYEYDFKRRPVNARMVESDFGNHLTFDTEAWNTIEEARIARSIFDEWRMDNCLKTIEDFDKWEDYYLTRLSIRKTKFRLKKNENSSDILRRNFLRALVRNMWGLDRKHTYKQIAEWLTSVSASTNYGDLTNAKRKNALPLEDAVPVTSKTIKLLQHILSEYPELDYSKMFSPCDLNRVETLLNNKEL